MHNSTDKRIEYILSFSPAIIYACRVDGNFGATFVSENISSQFGYSTRECLDNPDFWRSNIHPDDCERVFENYGALYEKGHHTHEYRFRRKDGSYVWVLDEVNLIRDSEGNPVEIIGSWLDITQRKETEEVLLKSDVRYRLLTENAKDLIYRMSLPDGHYEYVSPASVDLFGYPPSEFYDSPKLIQKIIHPDWQKYFEEQWDKLEVGDMPPYYEYQIIHKSGETRWVHQRNVLIRDNSGQPVAIEGIASDITERKETEVALLKSEALFRAFFQANPVASIITSPLGLVHMVNPAFTSRTDFSAEEVVGRTAQELGFWRDPEDRNRMVAAIKEYGFIDNLETSFYGKDSKPMTCIVSSRAIEYKGEVRILSIVIDVTEQRKAEEALRKLDQAKSDFISTAAHELRTPLIAVIGYCELLENVDNNPLTEEQKKSYLSIVQSNAEILNHLVDDLLDVGRIQIGRSLGVVPKENDLSVIIEKAVQSLSVKSQRHDIIVTHDNALPGTVWLDRARITQVLNNLISNAIKYSPQGGTIIVETMTDEDTVTISIIDRGQGMTPQQIEHIFDRFYRGEDENSATSGLGLGMSIVKQIIVDHGGKISVSSQQGAGTTVTFTLPIRQ
ncbi:MAG: hypothetical protein DRH08_10435 [Deltaproteobacteria bacterium]|nr:MAG: hypothetical protein DRH08_10435 [Deltaproteobacteria bacterium]